MTMPAFLNNPFLTLCVPPVLMVLQFVTFVALYANGLPASAAETHTVAGLLIAALFALALPTVPAMLLGVRHILYDRNKVAPAMGIVFNGLYFLGFILFFVFFFVVKSTA